MRSDIFIHTTSWMNPKNIIQIKEAGHQGTHTVGFFL